MLRLTIGPMLMVHGYNKVFGKRRARRHHRLVRAPGPPAGARPRPAWRRPPSSGAGTLITVGAASPLPAAAAIGLMTTAARTDHRGKGFFMFRNGWEYVGVVGSGRGGHGRAGPGPVLGRPPDRPGAQRVCAGPWPPRRFGVVNAAALLAVSYRPDSPRPETGLSRGRAIAEGEPVLIEAAGQGGGDHPPGKRCSSRKRARTKLDLARYYQAVEPALLAAMGGRPVLLQRFPQRRRGPVLFPEESPGEAPGLAGDDHRGDPQRHHVAGARRRRPGSRAVGGQPGLPRVSRVAVPGGRPRARRRAAHRPGPVARGDFEMVREAAHEVDGLCCGARRSSGWPKTTGNRGIHVYVRLLPRGRRSRCGRPRWRWPASWSDAGPT